MKIGSSYLKLKKFPQSETTNVIVQMCEYSHYDIFFIKDISDIVID